MFTHNSILKKITGHIDAQILFTIYGIDYETTFSGNPICWLYMKIHSNNESLLDILSKKLLQKTYYINVVHNLKSIRPCTTNKFLIETNSLTLSIISEFDENFINLMLTKQYKNIMFHDFETENTLITITY